MTIEAMMHNQTQDSRCEKSNIKLFGRRFNKKDFADFFQSIYTNPESDQSFLSSIKIKTTRRCNLDCSFCTRGKKDTLIKGKADALTMEDFNNIFHDAKSLGAEKIHLTGGEFFIRRDYPQILNLATNLNLSISITSNGTLLNEKQIQNLKNYSISSIQFSLDSFSSEYHDRLRGQKGAFEKTILSLALMKNHLPGIKRNINMVATKYLFESRENALPLLEKILPDSLLLLPLKNTGISDNLFPVPEKVENFYLQTAPGIIDIFQRNKIKASLFLYPYSLEKNLIHLNLNPPNHKLPQNYLPSPANPFYKSNTCFAAWTHSYIHDNGKISICCHRPDGLILGNIKKQGLKDIFLGKRYKDARKILRKDSLKRCLSCEMFIKENQIFNKKKKQIAQLNFT